jgi:hypothetical protein
MAKPTKKQLEEALRRIAKMRGGTAIEPWQKGWNITVDPSDVARCALAGKVYEPSPWHIMEM